MVRILLVDDIPDALEVLEMIFAVNPNVEIVGTARNNDEALEVLKHTVVDLISIDIYMGMYNGFDLCRTVRRKMPQIFITMCSSEGSLENRRFASSLGAHFFLEKPVSIKNVSDLIDSYQQWSVRTL